MHASSGEPRRDSGREPSALLERARASGRVHSAYLLSGDTDAAQRAAERFARSLVCSAETNAPCEACRSCQRSSPGTTAEAAVAIDASGKRGPLYRHIGDHADLFWVDRGTESTRVRIGQIRALQIALRLGAHEGGWRAVVIADAEWLNAQAQNALLRLLEEPPERTTILLVANSAEILLATIRSRCQRVLFRRPRPPALHSDEAAEDQRAMAARLDQLGSAGIGELLTWAEDFRGERAKAVEQLHAFLLTGSQWLQERVIDRVQLCEGPDGRDGHEADPTTALRAFRALASCRNDLDRRNANPQMVAERALIALCEAAAR